MTSPPWPVPAPGAGGDPEDSAAFARLLEHRTVFLRGALDDAAAGALAAQLLALDGDRRGEPVTLLVNSPGGPLEPVFALLDTVELLRSPVETTCVGQATGTAAAVVACGTGRRLVTPSARLCLRLPEVELQGDFGDVGRLAAHLADRRRQLAGQVAARSAWAVDRVLEELERGHVLDPSEAVAAGLVDEVVHRP